MDVCLHVCIYLCLHGLVNACNLVRLHIIVGSFLSVLVLVEYWEEYALQITTLSSNQQTPQLANLASAAAWANAIVTGLVGSRYRGSRIFPHSNSWGQPVNYQFLNILASNSCSPWGRRTLTTCTTWGTLAILNHLLKLKHLIDIKLTYSKLFNLMKFKIVPFFFQFQFFTPLEVRLPEPSRATSTAP